MIKTIYPMLAGGGTCKDKWENPNYWAEEKVDGARYLMFIGETGNRFTSRQKSRKTGLPVEKTENVPHLANASLPCLAGTILDGEMQHYDFSQTVSVMGSKPDRAISLQEKIGFIHYYAFDILEYKGESVRNRPYRERRKLLEQVEREIFGLLGIEHFQITKVVKSDKKQFYETIVAKGGEGVILKHIDGLYEDGTRSGDWIKVKKYITDDVVIMGADKPTKEYTGKSKTWRYWETVSVNKDKYLDKEMTIADGLRFGCIPLTKAYFMGWIGAIKFGKYKNGKLIELGQTSGIEDEMKELLSDGRHEIKKEYIGQVMEIGAMEQIKKSGAYRHPRFIKLRPDRDAESCIWEVK